MKGNNAILPPSTIGIIGGGQLGRMMALAAKPMGYRVIVLDPTPDCPTAQVADEQIVASYDDMDAIKKLTNLSDIVTYEFENVDLQAATYIEEQGKLPQGSFALEVTQNREKEKQLIADLQLPVPNFSIVKNGAECEKALTNFSYPAVIKTCRGGYDGKGQLKIHAADDVSAAIEFAEKHQHCIIEEWITFDKEISVVFSRSTLGEMMYFPLAENEHKDHILHKTIAPARVNSDVEKKAYEAARIIAEKMNIVGTFAIEMFVQGNNIYINEMAPRPHNSGHYTIEACNVSQFAQHIRSICNLPLIGVRMTQPAVMRNVLGEDLQKVLYAMTCNDEAFVHLYGKKEAKEKRKMGHITFIGKTITDAIEQNHRYEEVIQK